MIKLTGALESILEFFSLIGTMITAFISNIITVFNTLASFGPIMAGLSSFLPGLLGFAITLTFSLGVARVVIDLL